MNAQRNRGMYLRVGERLAEIRKGGFMNKIARSNRRKHVPSVQLVHDRASQPRRGLNRHAFNRLRLSVNQSLLELLETENAQLRGSVVELALQIQALRDDARPSAV